MIRKVGDVVRLKRKLFAFSKHKLGVCVNCTEEHDLFLFKDGDYDFFSKEEQGVLMEDIGFCYPVSTYEFVDYNSLNSDFNNGLFKEVFHPPIIITMEGGVIHAVDNLPPGVDLVVMDMDTEGGDRENVFINPFSPNPVDEVYISSYSHEPEDFPLFPVRGWVHADNALPEDT